MADMFGWDLIYKSSEKELLKKEDALLLIIHFTLIKNGYRCIGLGDDKVLTGTEESSELLPSDWNSSKNYALRYVRENELYILRGVPVDDNMVFNLLKVSTVAVSNTAFNVETAVAALKGPLETIFPTSGEVVKKIKAELIDPLFTPVNKEATTQTTRSSPTPASTPSRREPAMPNLGRPAPFWPNPEYDPLLVGRQDLDPFARGGGMLFTPFGGGIPDPGAGIPGGLPRGSIPPGARFDPFGPPGAARGPRRPPDTDFDPGYYM